MATAAPATTSSKALALRIAALCQEFKATDVTILSLKGVSDMTDYFVIASGSSDTHVRSTAQRVEDELKGDGIRPAHEEGMQQGPPGVHPGRRLSTWKQTALASSRRGYCCPRH